MKCYPFRCLQSIRGWIECKVPLRVLGGHEAFAIGGIPAPYAFKPSGLAILQTCHRTSALRGRVSAA